MDKVHEQYKLGSGDVAAAATGEAAKRWDRRAMEKCKGGTKGIKIWRDGKSFCEANYGED